MSKTWHVCEAPDILENSQERYAIWHIIEKFRNGDGDMYEVRAKLGQSRSFVALNFARFMRRNPDWKDCWPVDFRYMTEDIGGTNHPQW